MGKLLILSLSDRSTLNLVTLHIQSMTAMFHFVRREIAELTESHETEVQSFERLSHHSGLGCKIFISLLTDDKIDKIGQRIQ